MWLTGNYISVHMHLHVHTFVFMPMHIYIEIFTAYVHVMYLLIMYVIVCTQYIFKHLGYKRVRGQSEATLQTDIGATKNFNIS